MGSSHKMFSYCSHIVTGLGLLGALTGTLTVIFYQDLYDAILKGQLAISEGSYSYDLWRKAPIPMFNKTSLSYFTPDLCRPIHFNFAEETEFMGVHGYRYILDQGLMGNSSYNASNWCYNPQPDLVPNDIDWSGHRNDSHAPLEDAVNMVLPTGLLNVSSCKFDPPAYVSFPHFYMA